MKVLFVDHSYHQITSSSNFFVELLRQFFDVEVFYADPQTPQDILKISEATGHDVAVLWQMDFLAPYFLARSIPTVVIPMYDGSGPMPDLHWLWSRKAKFINFSRRLHERVRSFGGDSLLVRYYPELKVDARLSDKHEDVRVFLWQRRPEHSINLHAIERMFGDSLSAVHIHNVLDDPSIDAESFLATERQDYELSFSKWLPSKEAYGELLEQFNFFVAPRRAEGIGMSFLEAMARGMIVCGHDDATHDEYISNGVNGFLFNADASQKIDVGSAAQRRQMSAMAIKSVEDGHMAWLDSKLKIIDFIKQAEPVLPSVPQLVSEDFLRGLIASYYASLHAYNSFLARNLSFGSDLSGVHLEDVLDDNFNYNPSAKNPPRQGQLRSAADRMPWLNQNSLRSEELADGAYILDGAVRLRDNIAWVAGEKLVLGFRVDVRTAAASKLMINIKRLVTDPVRYCLILNNVLLDAGPLTDQSVIEVPIPLRAIRIDNELHLQIEMVTNSESSNGETAGIQSIVFG
ncbi:glycosyltransferase [Pararhizobium sp. LjRoot238]|uniref:glycosyltransferase n=1 Tax=Pararhizobium sp. LjRoot238 TaxID=3342293 RepID=UPI003ECF7EA3